MIAAATYLNEREAQLLDLARRGDERARELVARYMDASERAYIDLLVALLTEDVAWTMPPFRTWYQGSTRSSRSSSSIH